MSGSRKDGMDNSGDYESGKIKKPVTTPNKYPFQTTKNKNNSKNKIKEENESQNLIDENKQSESKKNKAETLNKDSPNDVLRTQFVNEPIKQDKNVSKIVNETRNQSKEDLSPRIDAASSETLDNNKAPINQATGTIFLENEIALNLIQVSENKEERKKIRRKDLTEKEINEICGDENGKGKGKINTKTRTPGLDPRFQQQNQTMRCFVMYTDFYRCESILGKGEFACQWFKDVFTSICPLDWIRRWDEAREEGRLGWTKGRTQGKFPGDRYGV